MVFPTLLPKRIQMVHKLGIGTVDVRLLDGKFLAPGDMVSNSLVL